MAVTQRATSTQSDAAPLWLPRDETVVVDQAASRNPDYVEGYSTQDRLKVALLGSRSKMITNGATALAGLLFLAILPSLFGAGIGNLIKIVFYQSWTMALLLAVTTRVRSVAIGTAARYWLAGMFTVVLLVWFLNGPLASLAGTGSRSAVWVIPPLEELIKALPLLVAVFVGRRNWRTPGISDFMILGFAVGGGYAFHEDALWERATVSGIEANVGLFVPSIYQPDGLFVVGHAVWTALIGFAIGLFLLHRHEAWAVVAATFTALIAVLDHMAINDSEGTLGWVRQLTFNGRLLGLLFVVAAVLAFIVDQRRHATIGARDHLFPSVRALRSTPGTVVAEDDVVLSYLKARYRRRRLGVHNTIDSVARQWPPLSETSPAPVAELSRLGGVAEVAVGPGTASTGWAPDPDDPDAFRFVGARGVTVYTADESDAAPAPAPVVAEDAGPLAKLNFKSTTAAGPTVTSVSTPSSRPEAEAAPTKASPTEYWQFVGLGAVAVALFVLVRLLTAGDPSTALIVEASLPDAPNDPLLILTILGGLAAGVALPGRTQPAVAASWRYGPAADPTPERPDECEA